jgi:transcriptional regulator of acetoin/glycerol metabolism
MKRKTDRRQKFDRLRNKIEPWHVTQAMEVFDATVKAKGDRILAAALLGIGRTTLYMKIERYHLRRRIHQAIAKSESR